MSDIPPWTVRSPRGVLMRGISRSRTRGARVTAEEHITYELDGKVALIGTNRPEKRNALTEDMHAEHGRFAERAGQEAKAAVAFGVGAHFYAGLDQAEFMKELHDGRGRRPALGRHIPHVAFDHIARGRIPLHHGAERCGGRSGAGGGSVGAQSTDSTDRGSAPRAIPVPATWASRPR
ncbi:hypothetical protein [Streptomyces sp. NPDC047061]|uniref:hypothetical protein n=1 Tax=Streptomyces sp. NPDC047061 TaxID=3154605 RepID=UPI0033F4F5B2